MAKTKKPHIRYQEDDTIPDYDYENDPDRRLTRPHLMTRLSSAFLDFVVYVALVFGLFFACKALFYGPMGYDSAREFMIARMDDSGLFVKEGTFYYTVNNRYDETKTAMENYHDRIVYYFSNNEYPISENKLDEYYRLLDAAPEYFTKVSEGVYEVAADAEAANVRVWLMTEYLSVVDYMYAEPAYVQAANTRTMVVYWNVLIAEAIGAGLYYIMIPLLLPHRATFMKFLFKMGLEDNRTREAPRRVNVLARELVFIALDIFLPTFWYFFVNSVGFLAMVFPFANVLVMSISLTNSALHDFAGRTIVISLRKSSM